MEGNIPKVEAVLFAIGKEVTVERIANLCLLKEEEVKSRMISLMKTFTKEFKEAGITQEDLAREIKAARKAK